MKSRLIVWAGIAGATVVLALGGFGLWLLSLPATATAAGVPAVDRREAQAMLDALRPPKRARPAVAVIGINDATETTDYLVPAGILRRSDVADVQLLATGPGEVKLFPALTVRPDATIAEFDTQYPDGADFVVVPAMSRDDDPVALAWIRNQAAKGATVIGVCAGAKVVGAAGLLDGRRATTHWYYLPQLRRQSPEAVYVPNRRFVTDRRVVTTTGITASLPFSLTLIEAISGRARAEAVAQELGVTRWDAAHDSRAFAFTRRFALTVLGNIMAFWRREELQIPLSVAIDEVSLALVSDAWSRTYRSRAVTYAGTTADIESLTGVRIVPDRAARTDTVGQVVPAVVGHTPLAALRQALAAIQQRYGAETAHVVAAQLEYPEREVP